MSHWLDFDLDATVHDFEYTRRAAVKMNRIIDSSDFEQMDADMIFDYLSKEMEIVVFPDYLRRYIYSRINTRVPFSEVPREEYLRILTDSFTDNSAPWSLTPTSTKRSAMFKLWLSQPGASRNTVFALGFGLRMNAADVSEFLTKVLKEEDFNFNSPEETIYWFCYQNNLPYASALRLMRTFEDLPVVPFSDKKWKTLASVPRLYLLTEENLLQYLSMLKAGEIWKKTSNAALNEFENLYRRCQKIICDIYEKEQLIDNGSRQWTPDMIRPADLEKVLCSGIPVNSKNNLESMSASLFSGLFQNKRMSRQRISSILAKKHQVERFDLITLLFFIYAETVEPDWPAERYLQYIDEISEILERCHMLGIYPANPYEAFILMCIVTDDPMDVYAEVWEKSYEA